MQKRCRDVRVVLVVENLAPLFDTFPEQGRQKDALHGEGPAMVAEVLQEPDDLPEVTAGDAVLVLQPLGEPGRVRVFELIRRAVDDHLAAVCLDDVRDDVDVTIVRVGDADAPVLACRLRSICAVVVEHIPDDLV